MLDDQGTVARPSGGISYGPVRSVQGFRRAIRGARTAAEPGGDGRVVCPSVIEAFPRMEYNFLCARPIAALSSLSDRTGRTGSSPFRGPNHDYRRASPWTKLSCRPLAAPGRKSLREPQPGAQPGSRRRLPGSRGLRPPRPSPPLGRPIRPGGAPAAFAGPSCSTTSPRSSSARPTTSPSSWPASAARSSPNAGPRSSKGCT